jgi:hypothetical protein
MERMPQLDLMPWVSDDVEQCVEFIARQPWGKPEERRQDIRRGITEALLWPKLNPVKLRRPSKGLEFRCRKAAQFMVIYAYLPPSPKFPNGVVSIRAVRHRRVRNMFGGVKEPAQIKTPSPLRDGVFARQSVRPAGPEFNLT